LLGDDIAFQTAFQTADVGRGLLIDTPQGKLAQYLGGDEQRGDAFFGLQTGMGGPSGYLGGDHVLGWGGEDDAVGRTFTVEDHSRFGRDHTEI